MKQEYINGCTVVTYPNGDVQAICAEQNCWIYLDKHKYPHRCKLYGDALYVDGKFHKFINKRTPNPIIEQLTKDIRNKLKRFSNL